LDADQVPFYTESTLSEHPRNIPIMFSKQSFTLWGVDEECPRNGHLIFSNISGTFSHSGWVLKFLNCLYMRKKVLERHKLSE